MSAPASAEKSRGYILRGGGGRDLRGRRRRHLFDARHPPAASANSIALPPASREIGAQTAPDRLEPQQQPRDTPSSAETLAVCYVRGGWGWGSGSLGAVGVFVDGCGWFSGFNLWSCFGLLGKGRDFDLENEYCFKYTRGSTLLRTK